MVWLLLIVLARLASVSVAPATPRVIVEPEEMPVIALSAATPVRPAPNSVIEPLNCWLAALALMVAIVDPAVIAPVATATTVLVGAAAAVDVSVMLLPVTD